mmetsp:Transcript_4142/g.15623  ORF Transcript_4142/g.15623 Transcript_4142/m.15623 type:complete len:86 (+) Transcript_4142:2580-2837(+)
MELQYSTYTMSNPFGKLIVCIAAYLGNSILHKTLSDGQASRSHTEAERSDDCHRCDTSLLLITGVSSKMFNYFDECFTAMTVRQA